MCLHQSTRRFVYKRDRGFCFYCDTKVDSRKYTVDHVIPKIRNGHDGKMNLVLSCEECNTLKGSLPAVFFLKHREEIRDAIRKESAIFS